ncbi:hypothetical protein U0070_000432 [Myodes glareolus]|uniref:Uncharacterized protein n=1 Tax=Myodes glareolus TaxID=447135 RepID=A0AAW0IQF2_MYOGA
MGRIRVTRLTRLYYDNYLAAVVVSSSSSGRHGGGCHSSASEARPIAARALHDSNKGMALPRAVRGLTPVYPVICAR